MKTINTYQDYKDALDKVRGALELTERVLARAAQNEDISLEQLIELSTYAHPEEG